MKEPGYIKMINQLNSGNVWVEKRIELDITADQFIALLKGYLPHWDMRYGILFNHYDHYLYAYRSGYVVGKYQFVKNRNDGYTCSEMYDNPEKSDCMVIFEIIKEACRVHEIELDVRKYVDQLMKTEDMNGIKRNY